MAKREKELTYNMKRKWRLRLPAMLLALLLASAAGAWAEDLPLAEAQARLEEERGAPYVLWTVEEKYAFYQAHQEAFDALAGQQARPGLPRGEDVALYDAYTSACNGIERLYGEWAMHAYDTSSVGISYMIYDSGRRLWEITFYIGPPNAPHDIFYTAVDAETGELVKAYAGKTRLPAAPAALC